MAEFDVVQQVAVPDVTFDSDVDGTLPGDLTAGNTLIVVLAIRPEGTAPNPTFEVGTVTGDPTTGWAQFWDVQVDLGGSTSRYLLGYYTHTDTLTLTQRTYGFDFDEIQRVKLLWLIEYEGVLTFDQVSTGDSGVSEVDTLSTGTTPTTTEANELIFAALAVRESASGVITWTNSMVDVAAKINGGGSAENLSLAVSDKTVSTTGTQETTASWDVVEEAVAGIATFSGAGGAGGQTIAAAAVTETETAQTVAPISDTTIGMAAESESAGIVVPVGALQTVSVVYAIEQESETRFSAAVETETAQAVVPSVFSSTSLYATGDGTIVNVVNEADAASPLAPSIDDDPDSPTDADWVNNAVTVA